MNKGKKNTRQLCGIKELADAIAVTYNKERLAYFKVSPINISVLSPENMSSKIRHLTNVLSSIESIELCCMDSSECFDDNKLYLKKRIEEETCKSVRDLLQKDYEFLDKIQLETATAREFVFIARFRNENDEQMINAINRIEKTIHDYCFDVHRMDQAAVKRMFAIYFEQRINTDTSSRVIV